MIIPAIVGFEATIIDANPPDARASIRGLPCMAFSFERFTVAPSHRETLGKLSVAPRKRDDDQSHQPRNP